MNTKYVFYLIFLLVSSNTFGLLFPSDIPPLIRITFINKTGHTLTVKAFYQNVKRPQEISLSKSEVKTVPYTFTTEELKNFLIDYTQKPLWSARTYISIISSTALIIQAEVLDDLLIEHNTDSITLIINPSTILGSNGYAVGFAIPTFSITSADNYSCTGSIQ